MLSRLAGFTKKTRTPNPKPPDTMPAGYHYTVKATRCTKCDRRLRRGEFYHGNQNTTNVMGSVLSRIVICLPCRGEERCFTETAAGEIIGTSHTTISKYALADHIPGLRASEGRGGHRMVPLPWILEQKEKRQQRQPQAGSSSYDPNLASPNPCFKKR